MKHRNPISVAMNKRYQGSTIMADRRAPRGGNKNEQEELRQEYDQDIEAEIEPVIDSE